MQINPSQIIGYSNSPGNSDLFYGYNPTSGERLSIGFSEATQEEIDREVQKIARQQREAVAAVRAKLQKEGAIGRIAGHIRTEKTLSFLFEQSRKEAAKPSEA